MRGKVAIVTGSTSGIGLGIAEAFAAQGAHVMLNGFGDAGEIESTRGKLASHFGVKVGYNGADMSKPGDIEKLVQATRSELGAVDVLVNNAGIQHVAPIEEFPPEKYEQILAINLNSAFYLIHHTMKAMKERGWGRILNIASAHGLVASPFKSAYVAAKHGIVGLTKTVALEGAEHGVTCNAICPGYVHTPLVDKQIADQAKARGISEDEVKKKVILEAQPTKQFVQVSEVASLAVYLCSDAAKNITGAALQIDGGWVAE
jgi:3-hydroxybutyrate dehydrogenase